MCIFANADSFARMGLPDIRHTEGASFLHYKARKQLQKETVFYAIFLIDFGVRREKDSAILCS